MHVIEHIFIYFFCSVSRVHVRAGQRLLCQTAEQPSAGAVLQRGRCLLLAGAVERRQVALVQLRDDTRGPRPTDRAKTGKRLRTAFV